MARYLGAVMRASLFFLGFLVLFLGFSAPAAAADGSADSEARAFLESSDIGRAAIAESPEAYSRAFQELSNSPPGAIASAFGAETAQGENLFHLMARAKTHREFFAGEILYAAAFLSNKLPASLSSLYYWMIEHKNQKGETPLETARAAGHDLAYKNLLELDLMTRQEGKQKKSARRKRGFRNIASFFGGASFIKADEPALYASEAPAGKKRGGAEEKYNYEEGFFRQAGVLTSTGMIIMLHSSDFIITGLGGLALAFGLAGGARACREAFRKRKNKQ